MREKMKGKSMVFLFIILFGFVMLPVTAVASNVPCSELSSVFSTIPSGAICDRATDDTGDWTLSAMAYQSICGQDKQGNNIRCTNFNYAVTDYPVGVYPNQANVKITAVCEAGDISLVSPTDRSIKIRICDPNSLLWCNDPTSRAITADALKNFPNQPTTFNFSTTPASISTTTVVGLVTAIGNIIISPSIGPGCCSETNVETNLIRELTLASGDRTELSVDYGLCSSIPTSVSYTTYNSDDVVIGSGQATELTNGLAHCAQNSRTLDIDTKSCKPIKKFGPEKGFYALVDKVDSCIPDPGDPTQGILPTACEGYGYFGWGTKLYQIPLQVPYPFDINCSISNVDQVPRRKSVVIDGIFKIVYDGCGSGEIFDAQTGVKLAGDGIPNQVLYLVPYNSSGNLNLDQKGILISGSAEGASFTGCSGSIVGGRYICR